MEFRTEDRQALIIRQGGEKVGVIQHFNTETLQAHRIVFNSLLSKDVERAMNIVFVGESKEQDLGTFEIKSRGSRYLCNDYLIICEAQLKHID